MRVKLCAAAAMIMFLMSSQAFALTISAFKSNDTTHINEWIAGLSGSVQVLENFETVATGWYQSTTTSLGTFTADGSIGTGATSYHAIDPTATDPYFSIRDTAWYGRGNTTINGSKYLDSGDIDGLTLTLNSDFEYTNLFFFLQDPSDVGATTTITSGNEDITFQGLGNGSLWFIGISSENPIDSITWKTSNQDDGYGLDDFSTVASVPEPATMLLLGTGLLGLAGIGRKKRFKA